MNRALVSLLSLIFAALVCAETPVGEGSETISSTDIVSAGSNTACIDFQAVGVCIWMLCTPYGCDFDTTIKYAHNIPELVATSYPVTGESPWQEVKSYASPNSQAEGGGSNTEGSTTHSEQALRFRNVDVIGSPANISFDAMASSETFCEPEATAYLPYFLSTLDYAWRNALVESLLVVGNLTKRVSNGSADFAPLYPRIGFVKQGHDYKAGLVGAKRAADFVTRRWQPHVYIPAVWTSDSGSGRWPPQDPVDENTLWQQLTPSGDNACKALPDIDDTSSADDPYSERLNETAGYAWHIWRRYRCCYPPGEGWVLVGHGGE